MICVLGCAVWSAIIIYSRLPLPQIHGVFFEWGPFFWVDWPRLKFGQGPDSKNGPGSKFSHFFNLKRLLYFDFFLNILPDLIKNAFFFLQKPLLSMKGECSKNENGPTPKHAVFLSRGHFQNGPGSNFPHLKIAPTQWPRLKKKTPCPQAFL